MRYVVVYTHEGNAWGAYLPDVPGCIATGRDRAEVATNIREALQWHLEDLCRQGDPLPSPGEYAEIVEAREEQGQIVIAEEPQAGGLA